MVEILNFEKGATIIKSNTAVTNLNVWVILCPTAGEIRAHNIYRLRIKASSVRVSMTIQVWGNSGKYSLQIPVRFKPHLFLCGECMSGGEALKPMMKTCFPGSEEINEEYAAQRSSGLFSQGKRDCILV
jgi:hypothetical protein